MTKKTVRVKEDPIVALIRRTDQENPKAEDLERIRKILDENDTLVRINESSKQAFDRVIGSYTKSALSKELFKRQIAAKRKDLDYESANVIVRMLIDQVIICHIRLNAFEGFHAGKVQESLTLGWHEHYDKMLSSYQKRFQKACESLAKVKNLLAEAEMKEERANNARKQGTLASQRLYKSLSDK